jgi:hypothetical protein
MRIQTFVATAVLAVLVGAAPLATAQQRWPGGGGGGAQRGDGGGQRQSGGNQGGGDRSAGQRSAAPREGGRVQQAPRESGRAQQAPRESGRVEQRGDNGRREVTPQPRREPQSSAQGRVGERRDDGRRDGRNDGWNNSGRYATPRTGPVPRYRDGDRRVYVQPRPNYYVYRYPSYRYGYPSRYYGYRYYDPYYRGDFFWSDYGWRPRSYYYGSNWDYDLGKLRLDIDQRDAEVYIDGYYAGVVDDFDGRLQGLRLEAGNYSVEVGLPGFVPLQFDVHVQPGRTTTYRGSLLPEP